MNITIINGIQNVQENPFQMQLELACVKLSKEHKVDLFTIEDMDINYCCGCFNCWVKTPGVCIFKDDMEKVLKSIVDTDVLLFVSPINAGFITSEAKRAMDRIIPVLLPYINIFDGESHHVPRYDKRSSLGVVILNDGNVENEAKEIVYNTFDRFAKNYHAKKLIKTTTMIEDLQEVLENETRDC